MRPRRSTRGSREGANNSSIGLHGRVVTQAGWRPRRCVRCRSVIVALTAAEWSQVGGALFTALAALAALATVVRAGRDRRDRALPSFEVEVLQDLVQQQVRLY